MKDADAATRSLGRGESEGDAVQEIADYKANLIAGGMGGSDLEQRQYLQEKSSGITTDDFARLGKPLQEELRAGYDVEPASQGLCRNSRTRRRSD